MRRLVSIVITVLLTGMLLESCSVQDVNQPGSSTPAAPALITTSAQGAQATSQIAQTRELVLTSTQLFKNLGDFALSVMDPALPNQNTDITCSDNGAFQYSGTYSSGTGAYSLTLTFNGCRDKGYQYVGSYTVTGTPTNFTINLGSSSTFNIFNFNPSYTVLLAYLKANSRFTMAGSGTVTDAAYTITSNGTITSFDYFLLNTYEMKLTNLKADYLLATDATTQDQTISINANGSFSETWGGGTSRVVVTLANFAVDKIRRFSGSYNADDTSVNGRATFSFTPSNFGLRGMFNVVTPVAVHSAYTPSLHTTQGTLATNGTATAQYNAGSDIDVTVTPDTPLNYVNEYNMMKLADYAAMEQDKPPLITPPGAPVSLPTGTTMAVTLTWTGPAPTYASASDMDLHVKYYNTSTPTGATTATWHLDYASAKSCTDPTGITFSDAFDLNTDGRCDVGLDFDDVDGFGPEHITALTIPTGYYVVSVDNFSLHGNTSALLYLSLNIGDSIFGPYTGTLSVADGNGSTPAAWLRVADVRVNADGSVDVLAPDLTLTPWH